MYLLLRIMEATGIPIDIPIPTFIKIMIRWEFSHWFSFQTHSIYLVENVKSKPIWHLIHEERLSSEFIKHLSLLCRYRYHTGTRYDEHLYWLWNLSVLYWCVHRHRWRYWSYPPPMHLPNLTNLPNRIFKCTYFLRRAATATTTKGEKKCWSRECA